MKRSDIKIMSETQAANVNELQEDIELLEALEKYGKPFFRAEEEKLVQLDNKVYAPGKWTVKDILQHMMDAERVFAYRAMRFARNDKTPLPAFEENEYASTAMASKRDIRDLLDEFYTLREASIKLFKSFSNEMLMRAGELPSGNTSVLTIGFIITSHGIHHMRIIKERYFKLL